MPKYHLHFATDKEHDMRSMLQLALATDVVGKAAAIICPDEGVYTLRQHMYIRRNFVAIYVSKDKTALDTHKHFIEAGGHSEHAWFISRLQTPEKLEAVRTGPKNSMPHHSKPKAKGKTPEELLKKLRAPSQRGLQENHAAIPLPDRGAEKSPLEASIPVSSSDMSFMAVSPQQGYCKARLWAEGLLIQCKAFSGDE